MSDLNPNQYSKYRGVKGWLLLLCIALTIGSPLRTLYNIIVTYVTTKQYFELFPGLLNIYYLDSILGVVLMIFSIRAGLALWSIQSGAVKTAKNYLFLFLGYTVVSMFFPFMAGLPSAVNDAMIYEVAQSFLSSLLFFVVWFFYLNVSKRVEVTYSDMGDTPVVPIELESI